MWRTRVRIEWALWRGSGAAPRALVHAWSTALQALERTAILGGSGGRWIWRLPPDEAVPRWALAGRFFTVTRHAAELAIVCESRLCPENVRHHGSWRALVVQGPLNLDLTGVLAAVVCPLSAESRRKLRIRKTPFAGASCTARLIAPATWTAERLRPARPVHRASASRAIGSPLTKIVSIVSYAATVSNGLARRSSRSAGLPASIHPASPERPKTAAFSSVAARRICAARSSCSHTGIDAGEDQDEVDRVGDAVGDDRRRVTRIRRRGYHRRMRFLARVKKLMAVTAGSMAALSTARAEGPRTAYHARLGVFVGKWNVVGDMTPSALSPGGRFAGVHNGAWDFGRLLRRHAIQRHGQRATGQPDRSVRLGRRQQVLHLRLLQ